MCASLIRSLLTRSNCMLLSVVVLTASCSAQPAATEPADDQAAPPVSAPIVTKTRLKPPMLLRHVSVTPLEGKALKAAQLELDQAMGQLTVPDYLKSDEKAEPEAAPDKFDEPSTEALRLYAAAMEAYDDAQWRSALASLDKAIQHDPKSAAPHVLLAQVYIRINERVRCVQALTDALQRDPGNLLGLFLMGRLQFESGHWEQAAVALHRIQKDQERTLDPGVRYLSTYYLGQSLLRVGLDTAAKQVLEEYLREPENFTRSTRYYRDVTLVGRQRAAVNVQLGDLACRLGHFNQALQEYQAAAETDRIDERQLGARLTYVYLVLGQTDQAHQLALNLLNQANRSIGIGLLDYLSKNTTDPKGLLAQVEQAYVDQERPEQLALACMRLKDGKAAIEFARKDLLAAAGHFQVYSALLDRLGTKQLNRAVAFTIELIEKSPAHAPQLVALLTEMPVETKAWDKAIDAQPRKVADGPGGWHLRGMVAFRLGKLDLADEYFNRALDRSPDYVPAQIAIIEVLLKRAETAEPVKQREINEKAARQIAAMDVRSHPQLKMLYVEALSGLGRYREALVTVDQLLAERPGNTDLALRRAELQRKIRDFGGAELTLLGLIRAEPRSQEAYRQLFDIYERESRNDGKFAQLTQRVVQQMPLSILARLKQARLLWLQGDSDRVKPILDALMKQDVAANRYDLAAFILLLGQTDRWADAGTVLEGVLDKDPLNRPAIELLRQVTSIVGQPERFYGRFETFLKGQPENATTFAQLSDLYVVWKRLPEAIAAMQKVISFKPDRVEYHHLHLAELYSRAGQHDQAIAEADKAIEISPADSVFIAARGYLLFKADRKKDAETWMLKSIEDHPPLADDLRLSLAELYGEMDRIDDALKQIDVIIKAQPNRAADLYYLQSNLLHGKPDSAKLVERLLTKVLALDPDHVGANNDLGYSWADAGRNLARAEQMIRKAAKANPDVAAYLDSMGWVLYKRGKAEDAIVWLERARRARGGDDPIIVDHLADAYWQAGKKDTAVKLWRKAQVQIAEEGADAPKSHTKLLPLLKSKISAAGEGKTPQVAEVPQAPAEDVPPELPSPGVQ